MKPWRRTLRVHYPLTEGRIVLRTDLDWNKDVEAAATHNQTTFDFPCESDRPFLYFKPCWRIGDELRWSVGANQLLLLTGSGAHEVWPHFGGSDQGTFLPVVEIDSPMLGRKHLLRIYLPPGYAENTLKRYPLLLMQDGKNLFFPEEAYGGQDWNVDGSLQLLDGMNAIEPLVVIGVYSHDRMAEYTKPGYERYGLSVVQEVVPEANRRLRLVGGPRATAVMGSSLGGVVSFFLAWQWPTVFGAAACLSSTFSYRDDLLERVLAEPKSPAKFYIDSGWPEDNYEATLAMALALQSRGYIPGRDFLHLAFPLHGHEESAWGRRLPLPLQLFWGRISMAERGREG